ncbi:MAG: RDD family protein [Kiritimatiellae bacterium]|nr:RDD family protein [Kiritimatiellia bacterium]
MNRRMPAMIVRTPEGVRFALHLATPVTRGLAAVTDTAAVALLSRLAGLTISLVAVVDEDFALALNVLIFFVLTIGYSMTLEWFWRGQTLGKRLLGLRVMDARGLPLRLPQVVLRNLLRAVDSLPILYVVGGFAAWCSRHGQRLGDLAADTIVVRLAQPVPPDIATLGAPGYNSFRKYPHLEARLRQLVAPEEAAIVFAAVQRRDELDPDARLRLFAELAADLRGRVRFPPEAVEELADEQYLRNVLDSLHGRRNRDPEPRHVCTPI